MRIVSARENPEKIPEMLSYIKSHWASPASARVYDDCLAHCAGVASPLPQWYALEEGGRLVGCAGLIANDFISRQDLFPWLCALYVEQDMRGRALGRLLIDRAREDARAAGFQKVYLCTDHVGYYEKYGFTYIGDGYHPWGESSRVYEG